MAAPTAWAFTANGRQYLLEAGFPSWTTATQWRIGLFTSSWSTSTVTYSTTNEVATAYGYTQGGISITMTDIGTTTEKATTATAMVWSASGGSIVARYAAIWNSTSPYNILCWCTLDSTPADVTATTGNTLTITMNASGIFTLA